METVEFEFSMHENVIILALDHYGEVTQQISQGGNLLYEVVYFYNGEQKAIVCYAHNLKEIQI